jgi:trehalose 6-phosphate synthase/phosphatase
VRSVAARVLLLDYDGTLVPFADRPELAAPDPQLVALLSSLAADPSNAVHVVSGRSRESIERWLGALAIGLHAEHGLWSRYAASAPWTSASVGRDWMQRVRRTMDDFSARAPGAWTEEKSASLAWHYRLAGPAVGAPLAAELHAALARGAEGYEVLDGTCVVEARPIGVHKGTVVAEIVRRAPVGSAILAIGDDVTDEDLFAALPEGAASYKVGAGPTRAKHRLADVDAVRALLSSFAPRASTEDASSR